MACLFLAIGEIIYGIITKDSKAILAGILTFLVCQEINQQITTSETCPVPQNYVCYEQNNYYTCFPPGGKPLLFVQGV